MANSTKYQIPADLAASIYDIALSEGIDPALGFQLVKIESGFKANARSAMGAFGYTQLQVATARFYQPGVTERDSDRPRAEPADRVPVPERPAGRGSTATRHLALLAYNRGPAKVAEILAQGGDPANGYSDAVLEGLLGRRARRGRAGASRGILSGEPGPACRGRAPLKPVRFSEGLDRDAVAVSPGLSSVSPRAAPNVRSRAAVVWPPAAAIWRCRCVGSERGERRTRGGVTRAADPRGSPRSSEPVPGPELSQRSRRTRPRGPRASRRAAPGGSRWGCSPPAPPGRPCAAPPRWRSRRRSARSPAGPTAATRPRSSGLASVRSLRLTW